MKIEVDILTLFLLYVGGVFSGWAMREVFDAVELARRKYLQTHRRRRG